MHLKLQKSTIHLKAAIPITGSKSESNRLLMLQNLYPNISITNLSNSDDTQLMQKALEVSSSSSNSIEVDVHHAGTAMRFLTAYFSVKKNTQVILTGSSRMKQRPIKILVDTLQSLGADIQYIENEGFPPLKINGKTLAKNKATLKANVSSQYISALLLIASKLDNGLQLTLEGKITSLPYIKMTLNLLKQVGITTHFNANTITIQPLKHSLKPQTISVESDWSSASYWYSIIALAPLHTQVTLSTYKKQSLQGDSVLADLYKTFGVSTSFTDNHICIKKTDIKNKKTHINLNLSNAPDIAQTIAVTAFGLGWQCDLTGLHTLKIKETDRLIALQNELSKFGAIVKITDTSFHLKPHNIFTNNTNTNATTVVVKTYNDHRMAMAFAPLALKTSFTINNADVVSKSYPNFWEHLKLVGFKFDAL